MATDRWNRLRACTGGLGMSMRMASSSSSSHCRATLGPWSRSGLPAAAEADGSDRRRITKIVSDATGLNRTIKFLPETLFQYRACQTNATKIGGFPGMSAPEDWSPPSPGFILVPHEEH